ncbi:MAG: ATP-binding protein [Lachnospiraceae bacterium]|nr:ATP-binding protein [Lachnospiraceae bacterium]
MEFIYGLIDFVCVIICIISCGIVLRENESKNSKYLLMTIICGLILSVGNLAEFLSTTTSAAMLSIKFAYIGKCFLTMFSLLFAAGFSHIKLPKCVLYFLEILNFILLGSIMLCEYIPFYYSSIDYRIIGNRVFMVLGKGIGWYLWAAELFIGVLWFAYTAAYEIYRKKNVSKAIQTRMLLLVISSMGPFLIGLLIVFTDVFEAFDPTSLAMTYFVVILLIDVKRFGLLDTMQAAKDRILEDSKDGIIVIDSNQSNILFANDVAKEMFPEINTDSGEMVIDRVFHSDEKVIKRDDRHFEIRTAPISAEDESLGFVAWIFDMSFIDNFTNEMIRLKEESEQANIAKTNFLAHMSHEIRTPMNAIVGFAELALRTGEIYLIKGYLKNIKDSAHTLLHLINEILDISKIETGKMDITAVTYQIREVIEEIRIMLEDAAAKKGLVLRIEIDQDIPHFMVGDRVKVQEIIINLMNNGIKYTNEGSVSLKLFVREETQKHVRICMEVQDTGIGIEEKNFGSVFKEFEQFDEEKNYGVEGSGLGLSIVKKFVEMMDGEVTFTSEYGKGTKFIVDLWQEIGINPKILTDSQNDTSNKETKIKTGKMLVVDDNDLNCTVAQGILECFGMTVDVAGSGAECLELLQDGNQYDIIFMDHMMPEMDGVETFHRIRGLGGNFSQIPIVLLTANAVSGVKERMIKEGFDAFLPKPIDIDELTEILKQYMGEEVS